MVYLKYAKVIGIVAILVAALVLMPLFYSKWRDAEARVDQVSSYAVSKSRDVSYYKNALNQEVAAKEAIVLDRKAFNELREDFQYLQQEFKGVKKNLRNIEQITKITASVHDTLVISNHDTLVMNQQAVAFSWQDDFNSIEGIVFKDSTLLSLDTEIPITMVVLWERKKFLGLKIGKREFSVQATSPNESARISGLENIDIRRR